MNHAVPPVFISGRQEDRGQQNDCEKYEVGGINGMKPHFCPFNAQASSSEPSYKIERNDCIHKANREKQGDWQNGKNYS